jgi:hypothetical protein
MTTRSTRRGAVAVALAAAALALSAVPAHAVVTISQWGAPGSWNGAEGTNNCTGAPREITTLSPIVGGSPAYPGAYQQVQMIPKYEYSGNGTNWYHGGWGNWQTATTYGTRSVRFGVQTTSITAGGYYWRVKMLFRWYVSGRQVAEVTNLFNAPGDGWGEYWAGYRAATASNGSGGFCLIY